MWKSMVAGTAALAIAGTSLAYAQQPGGRDGMMQGRQLNVEDLRAFGEARLAALKAGFVLAPGTAEKRAALQPAARGWGQAAGGRLQAPPGAPPAHPPSRGA